MDHLKKSDTLCLKGQNYSRGNTWITRCIIVATFANMTVSRCALSVGCNSGL